MSRVWTLPEALGLDAPKQLVSIVGGGGKTSLMFALAAALPGRVVITTTTRIFAAQMKLAPAVCYANDLDRLSGHLNDHRICLVVGEVDGEKARGVAAGLPGDLLARDDVDNVLVEADGSRMRPVKAPGDHEPVVPPETTLLIPIAGLDALHGPLDAVAHRPERIRALLDAGDLSPDGRLTPGGLARLLAHPDGGAKSLPAGARLIPLLNKAEDAQDLGPARATARHLLDAPDVDRVVIGAVRSEQPVREVRRRVMAVVPAAGQSARMGANKLLLPWGETTVLGQTLANLRASAVREVLVVTGYEAGPIEAVAGAAGMGTLHNPDHASGMLTSVQAAVRALPSAAALLVALGDQPLVRPETIDALLDAYAASPLGLVAPAHGGRRGNPVLLDRHHFAELLALPPDAAPRVLLARHPEDLLHVEVGDSGILVDLDTPEAYEQAKPPIQGRTARR
jgi:molybdenum cofactor cytidylyltransferase